MTVAFYDGDPATGGKAFDVERIPYINANGKYEVNVNYRALNCGAYRLFVKAGSGKAYEVTSGSSVLQVDCPTVCVSKACMRSPQYYALNLNRLPQGTVKVAGSGNNTRVSTDDTARIRMLLQGGTSRLHQLNQQYVAAQLSLLASGNSPSALGSNLLCYKLNFQPTQISTGVLLNPEMTLADFFDQVQQAGRSGNVIDQRLLVNLLEMLNGTDPQGRCGP